MTKLSALTLFLGLISAGFCLAQTSTTVTFSDGMTCNGSAHPTFSALSVGSTIHRGDPYIGSSNTINFSNLALSKNPDGCSISLYKLLFTGARLPTVVISIVNGASHEVLRITLSQVFVVSMDDAQALNSSPAEHVELAYQRIEIFDPITHAITGFDRSSTTIF